MVFGIAAVVFFLLAAWPYFLGTYIAVQCGAWNPSTERVAVGWCFEVAYIVGVVAGVMALRAWPRRLEADKDLRTAELAASDTVYEAKAGLLRRVVYRHGTCTEDHKSSESAETCLLSSAEELETSVFYARERSRAAKRSAVLWPSIVLAVGLAIGLAIPTVILSSSSPASSEPCPAPTSADGASATQITMPDIVGKNAEGVEDQLKSRGFNNVELSSANPIWLPSNWTVARTDPPAGCSVSSYQHVVVYVTK